MRRVSHRLLTAGAVLALFVLSSSVFAAEPDPFEPPQARIMPPIGVAAPTNEPTSDEARIKPPGGAPTSQIRILPPIGAPEPSLLGSLWMWIQFHVRVSPPVG